MKIFPVSNFVGDTEAKQDLWQPGPKYYGHIVLPQENLSTFDSYKVMDHLYRENHPDVACRYETLMAKRVSKIPLITHSIWLTNLDKPVELTDEFIRWFKESCGLHKVDKGWKHYLWVQDRNKLPKTVRELAGAGIEIKEVYRELCSEADFMGLKSYFDHEVAQSKFGRASDSLRYAILYKYGGIYRDIDFLMTRPFTGLALAYDFFAGIEYPYCFPCNAMFGCRRGHPVLKKALEIVARNYDPKRAPAYIEDAFKHPGKHGGELLHTLSLTGPIAFGIAFKKTFLDMGPTEFGLPIAEQPDGHKDRNILLPPEAFYWTQGKGKELSSFGWHAFSGTWFNPAFGSNG